MNPKEALEIDERFKRLENDIAAIKHSLKVAHNTIQMGSDEHRHLKSLVNGIEAEVKAINQEVFPQEYED